MMLQEDSTYPANAVLALSICVCKAGAKFNEIPIYEHVGALANVSEVSFKTP